jgi:hypothetical protein
LLALMTFMMSWRRSCLRWVAVIAGGVGWGPRNYSTGRAMRSAKLLTKFDQFCNFDLKHGFRHTIFFEDA